MFLNMELLGLRHFIHNAKTLAFLTISFVKVSKYGFTCMNLENKIE